MDPTLTAPVNPSDAADAIKKMGVLASLIPGMTQASGLAPGGPATSPSAVPPMIAAPDNTPQPPALTKPAGPVVSKVPAWATPATALTAPSAPSVPGDISANLTKPSAIPQPPGIIPDEDEPPLKPPGSPSYTPDVPPVLSAVTGADATSPKLSKMGRAKEIIGTAMNIGLPVAAGLEAAGNRGKAPATERYLEQRRFEAQQGVEKQKLGIEQQKATNEGEYRKALATQYGMVPYTYNDADGNPVTIMVQQKDVGRVGAAGVTGASREKVAAGNNDAKLQIAHINAGMPMVIPPQLAHIAGQDDLANKQLSGKSLQNFLKMVSARGVNLRDMGSEGLWAITKDGQRISQVTTQSPDIEKAAARGEGYALGRAKYTPVDILDEEGNLKAVSQLERLKSGKPTAASSIATGKAVDKVYEPAVESDTRLKQMYQQATDTSGASDQALLFNHIAMTGGQVRGLRMGEYLTEAHRQARGIPESVGVLWNRLASGESLSPQQRINFVHLAEQVRQSRWDAARRQSALLGTGSEPAPDEDLPPIEGLSTTPTVRPNAPTTRPSITPKAKPKSKPVGDTVTF